VVVVDGERELLGRVRGGVVRMVSVGKVMGIEGRSLEQRMGIELLLDEGVKLVTLVGRAGSGKSTIATACGLKQVLDGHYSRLVITRPVVPIGRDLGALPGPQPLDALVMTPGGWVKMGEIKEGMEVIGSDGLGKVVEGVYPQGEREVYSIETSDGRRVESCGEHLWLVKRDGVEKLLSLKEVLVGDYLPTLGWEWVSIKEISSIGFKEVQCIKICSDDHLYVTNDYVLTHNTLEEKMDPWIRPIRDALDYLLMTGGSKKSRNLTVDMLFRDGLVVIEPLTYIRGRNLGGSYIIAEEMQNSTLHEVRTLVTRVAEGSKIVLLGDFDQIDSAYLDIRSNGLSHVVEKMGGKSAIVGHIRLERVERSELANLAVEVL
jgi:predicted ribonuclease YlaK